MEKEKKKYKYYTKALRCPDGSRKYIRGKTQKELDEKVRQAQLEIDRGVNINDNTTVGQLAQMWIDLYKRPSLKPQSLRVVLHTVNNYIMPNLSHLKVREVKPAHIALVMSDAAHLSNSMQKKLISALRAIFYFAIENQLIARSPVPGSIKAAGERPEEREPLTLEESANLLDRLAEKEFYWANTFVQLCLYTGLRAGEACGLCWDCVDFENNQILVRRQAIVYDSAGVRLTTELKTPCSQRDIPAPPQLMAHLRKIKPRARTFSVLATKDGNMVNPKNVGVLLNSQVGDLYVHPHLLRHTYATRLVEAGMDIKTVQYLLGHSTPMMSMRVYAHYDRKSRHETTAKKVASVSFTA